MSPINLHAILAWGIDIGRTEEMKTFRQVNLHAHRRIEEEEVVDWLRQTSLDFKAYVVRIEG